MFETIAQLAAAAPEASNAATPTWKIVLMAWGLVMIAAVVAVNWYTASAGKKTNKEERKPETAQSPGVKKAPKIKVSRDLDDMW